MPHNPDLTQPVPTDVTSGSPPVDGARKSWHSRFSRGRGLVVGALVVGLGLGAVGGAAGTWAVTRDDTTGTRADGTPGLDRPGDSSFGPPGGRGGMPPGGRGGMPPGGGQAPNGTQQDGGTPGQLPGGGPGTDGSTGGSTHANGAAEAT